jgi:hypothetical protein
VESSSGLARQQVQWAMPWPLVLVGRLNSQAGHFSLELWEI